MPWAEHYKNSDNEHESQGFPPLSGFTFAHRASAQGYPAVSSILQALPLCREVVVAVSNDPDPLNHTLTAWARHQPKLRIVRFDTHDFSHGSADIRWWHNAYAVALNACTSEWVLRFDLDEFFHEHDWPSLMAALHLASIRGAAAIKTSFREVTADWRFAVEPAPFDQIRLWHRRRATPAWDGSQALPQGTVLDLSRVRCWHLDLLLPPELRAAKLARSYRTHFPDVTCAGQDPLFKHQLLAEQRPEAFDRLGWRRPERLVYLGSADAYPRALRLRARWLSRFTHSEGGRLARQMQGAREADSILPLPRSSADTAQARVAD